MTVGNFFSNIGHVLAKIFSPNAIKVEAAIADIALPGFAPLINSAATAIITAEGVAAAAGAQAGTGTQKMAYAVSLFQSTYNQWASQNGLAQEPAAVQNVLQQVFNLLQGLNVQLPASSGTPGVSTGSTTVSTAQPSVTEMAKSGTLL